jgi:tetratricopeptide (TPR) repeat protein
MKYAIPALLLFLFATLAYAQEMPEEPTPEKEPQAEPAPPLLELNPEQMREQIALLGSRFFANRARAQTTIARTGKACVTHLTRALESDNLLLRMKAVELLARLKQPEAVRPIIEMLRDFGPAFRKSARRALVKYGPDILPVINKLKAAGELKEATLPDAVLAAAYREPLLKLFAKEYTRRDEYERRCQEIAKLGAPAIPALFSLLDESLRGARSAKVSAANILNALAYFKDKRVIDRLEALYDNPIASSQKQNIVVALVRLGSEKRLNQWVNEQLKQTSNPESTYNSLGYLFHRLENWEKAEEYWRKAFDTAKAAGGRTQSHLYNFACALSLGGKHDKAVETLKSAIKNGYNDFQWMAQDKDFDPHTRASRLHRDSKETLPAVPA